MLFSDFILEMFDKPWKMIYDNDKTDQAKEILKTSDIHKDDSISYVRVHKLEGNNGHTISYYRNGALEIHHHDNSGASGKMHERPMRPNPRFISTMKHHLETEGLQKGHSVRMLASDDRMANHYHNIAKKIVSKNSKKSWRVHRHITMVAGKEIHNIEIHPYNPMTEMFTELLKEKQ